VAIASRLGQTLDVRGIYGGEAMTCRNCNKPISSQSGLCLDCLFKSYGSPHDGEYKRMQKWQARRDAERKQARRQYLLDACADITAQLKGPMSNVERAWLVADRKDFRAELAKIDKKEEVTA
jgi:hypothetical protein